MIDPILLYNNIAPFKRLLIYFDNSLLLLNITQ